MKAEELHLVAGADRRELERLHGAARSFLAGRAAPERVVFFAGIVIEETFLNLLDHAFAPGEKHRVDFTLRLEEGRFLVRVRDDGPPFDPTSAPAPDVTAPLESRREGGLGIHLMRSLSDEMRWRREGECNVLETWVRF